MSNTKRMQIPVDVQRLDPDPRTGICPLDGAAYIDIDELADRLEIGTLIDNLHDQLDKLHQRINSQDQRIDALERQLVS